MKTAGWILYLSLGVLATVASVQAAPTLKQQKVIADEPQDLSVPLNQGAQGQTDLGLIVPPQKTQAVELTVSTWQPKNVAVPSRLENPSAFRTTVPTVSLNGIHSLRDSFTLKYGAEILGLHRTGTLAGTGQTTNHQQTVYIPSLRIGGEFMPQRFANRFLQPFVTAALLPSLVITNRSVFGDEQMDFGVPFELSAAALVHIFKDYKLNLSVSRIVGDVKGSDFNGWSLTAGIRVLL